MEILLADVRYIEKLNDAFGQDYTILPTVCCPHLAPPVCAHPDMVLFDFGDGTIVCAPEVFSYYETLLCPYGVKLVQGKSALKSHYPEDVAYNVARAGNSLLGHPSAVDALILRMAEEKGFSFFATKQGYAKCSSCIVSDDGLITADPSIARSANNAGKDVLLITQTGISLPGYDCGFFGGATGLTSKSELLVFGDLVVHPDEIAIYNFCEKHGVRVRDIKGKPLTDIGTVMSIVV